MKNIVQTDSAPAAIGAYSQAVRCGGFLFVSGQIPLDPATGELIDGNGEAPIRRAFDNLAAVCRAGGATLDDIVKLSVYLTDLSDFALVNEVMAERFAKPYPARAALGVKTLPKNATIEVEAIVQLPE
ncbi:MAG: Rid family detoxifying hydrolase [Gammaproteobacteria bacterium]